jgi:hypothetical protein
MTKEPVRMVLLAEIASSPSAPRKDRKAMSLRANERCVAAPDDFGACCAAQARDLTHQEVSGKKEAATPARPGSLSDLAIASRLCSLGH